MPPHIHPYTSLKALFDVFEIWSCDGKLKIYRKLVDDAGGFTGLKLQLAGSLLVSEVSFKPEDNWQLFSQVKDYRIVHITHCSVTVSLVGSIPTWRWCWGGGGWCDCETSAPLLAGILAVQLHVFFMTLTEPLFDVSFILIPSNNSCFCLNATFLLLMFSPDIILVIYSIHMMKIKMFTIRIIKTLPNCILSQQLAKCCLFPL